MSLWKDKEKLRDLEAKLNELRKYKEDAEKMPYLERLAELTNNKADRVCEEYGDLPINELKQCIRVAENVRASGGRPQSSDLDRECQAYTYDQLTGEWKSVTVKDGDEPAY